VRRHLLASRLFALELRLQAATVEQGYVRRAIGGVIAGGIVAIEHRTELAAVISRRVGYGVAARQAVLAVNADMIFVAEGGSVRNFVRGWVMEAKEPAHAATQATSYS
jgi:hypothetical protein